VLPPRLVLVRTITTLNTDRLRWEFGIPWVSRHHALSRSVLGKIHSPSAPMPLCACGFFFGVCVCMCVCVCVCVFVYKRIYLEGAPRRPEGAGEGSGRGGRRRRHWRRGERRRDART